MGGLRILNVARRSNFRIASGVPTRRSGIGLLITDADQNANGYTHGSVVSHFSSGPLVLVETLN